MAPHDHRAAPRRRGPRNPRHDRQQPSAAVVREGRRVPGPRRRPLPRLIRLDALLEKRRRPGGPAAGRAAPACIATDDLAGLRSTAAGVELVTAPHPDSPGGDGWLLRWGQQLDVRVIRDAATAGRLSDGTPVQDLDVASYLAKYATKASQAVGLLAHRLTPASVGRYADPSTHVGRLIAAA